MFKLKITLADKLFSLIVRHRDKFICVRCQRKHEKSENTCDSSHYWSRSNRGTRFDFDNADTLCKIPCHTGRHQKNLGWEYQKQIKGIGGAEYDGAYTNFKKNQLGDKAFDEMMVRAHTPTKIDEKLICKVFKLLLTRMKENEKSNILGAK